VTSSALALVLASAAIHAYWNLIYKTSANQNTFAALKSACSWVMLAPFALWGAAHHSPPHPDLLWRAALSGAGYAGYFIFLSAGYRSGDFSLVYPISRAVGPALTALGGVLLLGERLSPFGVVGVTLVIGAVVIVSVLTRDTRATRLQSAMPVLWASLVGLMIALYGVNDKVGVAIADPFHFLWLGGTFCAPLLLVWVFAIGESAGLAVTWRNERSAVVRTAFLDSFSYMLYLFALQQAPTAYATPLRSASVVIAAVLGATVLRERHALIRVAAAVGVVAGVVLISRGG
jgi:drug/metabolite transporter (DMT)-like permease